MTDSTPKQPNRRTFLKRTALAAGGLAAAAGGAGYWLGRRRNPARTLGKKVIILGIDGMDPRLCAKMMSRGQLPNLARMRAQGGFSPLGTSIPPQSPVAWANFINGAGPGSHGIFDFIHRHPEDQCRPFYSAAESYPGEGGWEPPWDRRYSIPLDFWPFNHKKGGTLLKRQGEPFWDPLDAAGVPTTFYDLPSNYPPSPSHHGHHRCISGMGTPDMLGEYGVYQYFAEDVPPAGVKDLGGLRWRLSFSGETAEGEIVGPNNSLLKQPEPIKVKFTVHRDRRSNAAVLVVDDRKILLGVGQWSRWVQLTFTMTGPRLVPDQSVTGIVRFFLQEVSPNFRLYVSPINIDPSAPAQPLSEPPTFIQDVSKKRGLFYTTGFQEDHRARYNGIFDDDQYAKQADMVLEERLALYDYAVDDYEDGLLFFYFSSSDLQSHMFWWDPDEQPRHPSRSDAEARKNYDRVWKLYKRLDQVVGDLLDRYGGNATLIVMSDHGFANFGRQFNLNAWLKDRDQGYLQGANCTSILRDADWSVTAAYGLGINGLYLNLKGRERDGFVEPSQADMLLGEIQEKLLAVTDPDNNNAQVISNVYRADEVYNGPATAFAPDLIVGYARGYRASWATCLGEAEESILSDNDKAWSADHCADALEVPGVLFCNRPFRVGAWWRKTPMLVDLAPSILAEFGVAPTPQMTGRSLFS